MAQRGGVVRVRVPGRDLVDALAQQGDNVVLNVAPIAAVGHGIAQRDGEPEPLVELADEQQPRLGRDLPAVARGRELWLESEPALAYTPCRPHRPSCDLLDRVSTPRR